MAENADIVGRADALMRPDASSFGGRRRRVFIAAAVDKAIPISAPADDDDDFPVLTEVVSAEPAVPAAPAVRDDEALLAIIAADLVHSLEHQLAAELPTLIEAALVNAQIELRSGINSTMDMVLRDFLARRQQLKLPFEDPDRDDLPVPSQWL